MSGCGTVALLVCQLQKQHAKKKLFENNGHVHAFSPRAGIYNLLRSFFSKL